MRWLFASLLALLLPSGPARAETFDNASVIALSRAGLGSEVVLAKVSALPCNYDVSTGGLLALRAAGVAPAVVAAMVRRCAGTVAGEVPGAGGADARHAAGIYLAGAKPDQQLIQLRPAATVGIKRTGNGSLLFPRRATLTVAQPHAQVRTQSGRPTFHFYFDPVDEKVNTFGTAASEAAQSPNEFSLVRFRIDRDTRQLVVGRGQPLANVEGLDPRIALPFAIEQVGEGHFRISFATDLMQGEYGFVLVGEGPRNRVLYRIFDFAVGAE